MASARHGIAEEDGVLNIVRFARPAGRMKQEHRKEKVCGGVGVGTFGQRNTGDTPDREGGGQGAKNPGLHASTLHVPHLEKMRR